jgi:hypothetical protein
MSNEELLMEFEALRTRLNNGGKGRTLAEAANSIQLLYYWAYQKLVRAGLKPQIKKKYRLI